MVEEKMFAPSGIFWLFTGFIPNNRAVIQTPGPIGFFSVVKEDSMNNKDVIETDNGNHVENNLSDAAFSDEEDDIPLGMYYFTRLLNHP